MQHAPYSCDLSVCTRFWRDWCWVQNDFKESLFIEHLNCKAASYILYESTVLQYPDVGPISKTVKHYHGLDKLFF